MFFLHFAFQSLSRSQNSSFHHVHLRVTFGFVHPNCVLRNPLSEIEEHEEGKIFVKSLENGPLFGSFLQVNTSHRESVAVHLILKANLELWYGNRILREKNCYDLFCIVYPAVD